ncbi:MAG: cobalamin biosynthesis protein [Methanobacterium sp.]|nr:cobalamin biosynthesis protein [Methanobacterium sp.]
MNLISIIIIAVIIDVIFGEFPAKIHPVVWMGKLIDIYNGNLIKYRNKISGIILTLDLVIIFTLATYVLTSLLAFNNLIYLIVSALILTTTFAIKVLITSAQDIRTELDHDIGVARKSMSYLVSRDTSNLSKEDLISATIETLTENITDSVIAPIFYAFIFGVPGAVAYRVINTLDAMVGYKNPENIKIGWFPANVDDILNYIPARLTGILVVIAAFILRMNWKNAYKIMRRDARKPDSPNSGYSMAAAAGALEISLEKIGYYKIGDDLTNLTPDKISEALLLTKTTILLFIILIALLFGLFIVLLMQLGYKI